MTWNPYVIQTALQTGMSVREVEREARRSTLSLGEAYAQGFDSVEEYEEAMHDFLNGM